MIMSVMAGDIHEPTTPTRPFKSIGFSLIFVPLVIGLITGVLAGVAGIVALETAVRTGIVAALIFGIPYAGIMLFYKPGDIGASLEEDIPAPVEAPE